MYLQYRRQAQTTLEAFIHEEHPQGLDPLSKEMQQVSCRLCTSTLTSQHSFCYVCRCTTRRGHWSRFYKAHNGAQVAAHDGCVAYDSCFVPQEAST